MSGFVWQLVAALIAAAVVGLGFQSIFLAVVALIGVALVGEVFKRLVMQRSGPGLLVAARLVTTELESILDRLRRLETDPTLTEDYLLPNTEWARRRADLAATNTYAEVVAAYREVERVNDQWRWRKEGAKGGRIAANLQGDGLDELRNAATAAIRSLERLSRKPYETPAQR